MTAAGQSIGGRFPCARSALGGLIAELEADRLFELALQNGGGERLGQHFVRADLMGDLVGEALTVGGHDDDRDAGRLQLLVVAEDVAELQAVHLIHVQIA